MHKNFLVEALTDNPAQLPLSIEQQLEESLGHHRFIACSSLDLEYYAELNHCSISVAPSPQAICTWSWGGEEADRLFPNHHQVVWEVEQNNNKFQVLHLEWETGCGLEERNWVIGESEELAREFVLDVSRKTHTPGESILVFSGGSWIRSQALYEATQNSSFDDLILADDLKTVIKNDFLDFLGSVDKYRQLGLAWKRGALLVGPPGNGKTHFVRALIKELNVSSLYVQSLNHQYYTCEQMWQMVFKRARGLTPCILVLEDLDSLVNEKNRSFFLNQLDGIQQNHGLIILATTNYPERIDAAIIDRPSRFDRKYHFELPAIKERKQYLLHWQQKLRGETGWEEQQATEIAEDCAGFSFAYLKELIISSLLCWMSDSRSGFGEVLKTQIQMLKKQMKTE